MKPIKKVFVDAPTETFKALKWSWGECNNDKSLPRSMRCTRSCLAAPVSIALYALPLVSVAFTAHLYNQGYAASTILGAGVTLLSVFAVAATDRLIKESYRTNQTAEQHATEEPPVKELTK